MSILTAQARQDNHGSHSLPEPVLGRHHSNPVQGANAKARTLPCPPGMKSWQERGVEMPASDHDEHGRDDGIVREFLRVDNRPRLVLDRNCAVVWRNEAARRRLGRDGPLCLKGDRLVLAERHQEAHLHAFLHSLEGTPQRRAFRAGDGSWVVLAAWKAAARPDAPGRRNANGKSLADDSLYFVEFVCPHSSRSAKDSGLGAQFSLTPAECAVVDALVCQHSPVEAAEMLGVSINTVRTHVRRLYAKLDVNSQIQLVSLASAFASN